MFSKIIFVLATVCVVNASVITDNVFDDDPRTEVAADPKICNLQACNQLCRRLKFPGGACVNGRCKCDRLLNAEDEDSEISLSDLEDSVLQKDDPDTEFAMKPSRCYLKLCNLACRMLNKTSGACVDDRCKCGEKIKAEVTQELLSNPEDSVSPRACNNQKCNQLCRKKKFRGGACLGANCYCNKFLSQQDDDPQTEVAADPKICNLQACDQLCRRLKFPGGACVNGRCKCDRLLNAEDGVSEISLSDLEDSVLQKDDPDTEFAMKPSRCYLKLCNLACRMLNKTSGACVDDRCKCGEKIKAEVTQELLSNPEDSVSPRACNNQKCNQLCRKKKFRGGACLGANCYCNKFLSQQEEDMTDPAELLSLSSCNSMACDDQCRRTGWHSGVCINGQCKCDYFLNTEDAVSETLSNVEDDVSPKRCTEEACNKLCREFKFQEGVCILNRCRCRNYTTLQKDALADLAESLSLDDDFLSDNFLDTEDEVLENPLPASELSEDQTERGCNMRACHQLCRRLKFPGGACVNGRCKCDNFFRTEDAVDEYSEVAPRRVCKLRRCNRTCTRRGYEGARCVNGVCECYNKTQKDALTDLVESFSLQDDFPSDNFFDTEDAVDEYSELAPRRVCKLRRCNRTCTRRGYEGARCVNGVCECYNKTQKEPSLLNDVTSDEQEDFNLVEGSYEEELIVPSPRACSPMSCSQKCRRLNYPGGWCIAGLCQCL